MYHDKICKQALDSDKNNQKLYFAPIAILHHSSIVQPPPLMLYSPPETTPVLKNENDMEEGC